MNDRIPCGHYEALVTYLYDECEPAERERIAAHITQCASCTEELRGLQDTRAHLGAWTPPSLPLGFQITRTEAQPGKVLRPAAFGAQREGGWWRQPLPAWAQVAAAVLIFTAGMGVNSLRGSATVPAGSVTAERSDSTGVRPVAATAVSRADLARLDERLRSLETAQLDRTSVQIPRTAVASISERELMNRVQALIDARIEFTERQQNERNYKVLNNVAQRVDLMEERAQNQEDALRTMMGGSFVRASFSPSSAQR